MAKSFHCLAARRADVDAFDRAIEAINRAYRSRKFGRIQTWLFLYPALIMRQIAIILGLVLVGGCNGGGGNRAMSVQTRLESAVASGATTFDFAADPAFAWDRMYVLDCYSSRESAEKVLGFPWPEFSKTTIESSESVVLVVFVENRKVVGWFEQPRRIELGGLANEKGYARSEAGFEIQHTTGRVELKPQPPVIRAGNNQLPSQGGS